MFFYKLILTSCYLFVNKKKKLNEILVYFFCGKKIMKKDSTNDRHDYYLSIINTY